MQEAQKTVLLLVPQCDACLLKQIISSEHYRLIEAQSFYEAVKPILDSNVDVVICDICARGDDRWKHVLHLTQISESANKPKLIVCSSFHSPSLWAEVLNLGGYDLLLKPFDEKEVTKVLEYACTTKPKAFGASNGA